MTLGDAMTILTSKRAAACAMLFLFLSAENAAAQTYVIHRNDPSPAKGYGDVRISKAALPGQRIRVWWAMLLNPDCTSAGTMTAHVATEPRHGVVTLSDDPFYPNYVAPNPRASCDAHPAPGKQAFYTSAAGFHGHDKLAIENATAEGRMRRIVVNINVR